MEMNAADEFALNMERIGNFIHKSDYDAVLFGTQHNFSWITCGGDNQIIHGTELGFVNMLATAEKLYLITNNIEMPRVTQEEAGSIETEKVEYLWTGGDVADEVKKIVGNGDVASDFSFPGTMNEAEELSLLRVPLTQHEMDRYKKLAQMCAGALDKTMHELKPGMTEYEIQGVIGGKLMAQGIYPVVLLVGTDERIFNFRHPMPTEKKLEKYCMVVICAQRWGLILSMTRLVHFGTIPDAIVTRYDALHSVDMAYITASSVGASMKDVFHAGAAEYEKHGFKGEELKHYQGGTGGYLTREQGLHPQSEYVIQEGDVIAHNPTITGTKIEDSILVKSDGFEVLTISESWPCREITYNGITLKRPDILVR